MIEGEQIIADGKLYEPKDFKCEWCNDPLVIDVFYKIDGKNVCQGCRNKEKCTSCGFLITENRYVHIDNKNYHPDCFRCSECLKELDGKFASLDDKIFCIDCSDSKGHVKLEELCAKCCTPLEGNIINALGKHFHESCFRCHHCLSTFPKDEFMNYGGKPLCDACYEVQMQQDATPGTPGKQSTRNVSVPKIWDESNKDNLIRDLQENLPQRLEDLSPRSKEEHLEKFRITEGGKKHPRDYRTHAALGFQYDASHLKDMDGLNCQSPANNKQETSK